MRINELSDEVYVAAEPIVKIGRAEIDLLKKRVLLAPRGRVRICAHQNSDEPLHEMIIALKQNTYIRPHKHLKKSESFHIVEGEVDVVALDDAGGIREIIKLGEPASGKNFYYRLSTAVFHTLLIRSNLLILHETTNGPFQTGDAIFAAWAPEESDVAAAQAYMAALSDSVARCSGAT